MNFIKMLVLKRAITLVLTLLSVVFGTAQVSVTLQHASQGLNANIQCYDVVLENVTTTPIGIAGQNYRLYYDTDAAFLQEGSITSFLTPNYEPLKLVQHFFDADASGFGVLSYENHLGFINLATDYRLESGMPISLTKGTPFTVAQMCFEIKDGKVPTFTWGQDNLTHTYATAFVEIALLEGRSLLKGKIEKLEVQNAQQTKVQDGNVMDLSYFPNPFAENFNIKFNDALESDATLSVKNVWGEIIKTFIVPKGTEKWVLRGEEYMNGALIIEIKDNEGKTSVLKAIKVN